MAGIMNLPPEQRENAIRGMVAGLAAKLERNPDDVTGWTRLGRSYLVLGEAGKAADAYAKAMALAPQDKSLALGRAQALRAKEGETDRVPADEEAAYRQVATLDPDQPEA